MSLKAIHICFIVLSIALCFGFGYGSVRHHHIFLAAASFSSGITLIFYLFRFTQKMKRINPFVILFSILSGFPRLSWACSVCFGDPNSNLSRGAAAGVLFLMGVIVFVLTWIAALIFIWARKARKIKEIAQV